MHSGEVESFGVPVSIEGFETPVSPENLDFYALERWDVGFLFYSGMLLDTEGRQRPYFISWCLLGQSKHQPNRPRVSYTS